MKMRLVTGVAGAGAGLLLLIVSAGATGAGPRRITSVPVPRAQWPAASRQRAERHRGYSVPPSSCSTAGGNSFLGVTDFGSTAGGVGSAVLGGYSNLACDDYSGIGAGLYNVVAENNSAEGSFIGGGEHNVVTEQDAEVGSGYYNRGCG
jgi:hypothetical protein